jgi:L-ascorbate metabolism protein UlaG (beta-lactamase superfamily)
MTQIAFTWIGHATFLFEFDDKKVLLDPYITGNPSATIKPEDLSPDLIVVSHGHGDHISDVVSIANRTGAKVVTNVEIARWFGKNGLNEGLAVGTNTGGTYGAGFVKVKFTIAFHSSTMPDGASGGFPQGFILTAPDKRKVYFAGDTALFGDMRLYGEEGLTAALIPIGDHYTMGVDDSVRATVFLQPKVVVPMHYNTFPAIKQDGNAWAERIKTETQATPVVLKPGERYVLAE